jgi:hypothetical protein
MVGFLRRFSGNYNHGRHPRTYNRHSVEHAVAKYAGLRPRFIHARGTFIKKRPIWPMKRSFQAGEYASAVIKHKHTKPVKFDWLGSYKFIANYQSTVNVNIPTGRQSIAVSGPLFDFTNVSNLLAIINAESTSIANATSNSFFTQKLFIKSVVSEYMITNGGLTEMEVKLYVVIARHNRDAQVLPTNDWINGVTSPYEGDGGVLPSGGTGGAGYWGATPFQSTLFKKYWKVKRQHKMLMAAGQTLRYNVVNKMRSMFPLETHNTQSNVGGWTQYLLVVGRGAQVVKDAVPNTTTADGEICVAVNQTFRFATPVGSNTTLTSTTPFTTIVAAAERFVQQEAGTMIITGNTEE